MELATAAVGNHLLPDNHSQGQGTQLIFYLVVVAWMATYSLLAGYR